jgi:small subunit ribosomal protein S2
MALPQFTMHDLIEAGVHFGHKTRRWNPKMAPYLYGVRSDVHIIDLQQTFPLLQQALHAVREVVANNGRVLFVGTKRQASDLIADAANRCGQYYVNQRWLGGMLTNWQTIQNSIRKLRQIEEQLERKVSRLTKKERLNLQREKDKLEKSLGGIREMGGVPNIIFVIDTNREHLAIEEATRLGIPVIGILDSNSNTENVTYPIPGNDDATKAIRLYCELIADAALDGLQSAVTRAPAKQKSADKPELSAEEAFLAAEGKDEAPKAEKSTKPARGGKKADAAPAKKERQAPEVVVKKTPRSKAKTEAEETASDDSDAA